jgi:hypothetical protein
VVVGDDYDTSSILSTFPNSKIFSEDRFEIGTLRRSFWHQGEASSLRNEEVGFSLDFLKFFLTNTDSRFGDFADLVLTVHHKPDFVSAQISKEDTSF